MALALLSYVLWGIFPIYWKFLSGLGAFEILAHRIIWSFVFYLGMQVLVMNVPLRELRKVTTRDWIASALAALLIALNWGVYIYAVNTGRVLEGSLAYFINPIFNVVIGVAFFREAFPWALRFAVAFAFAGVAWRAVGAGGLPWITLVLAFTFCGYGVVKKRLKLVPAVSSVLEGAVVVLPAIVAAVLLRAENPVPISGQQWLLLVGSGAVTGLPLFLFSAAAQRIPYSILGLLQFIAPSLQFLVGAGLYGEVVRPSDWVSFGLIWCGVGFYLLHQARRAILMPRAAA